jgi:hypothetical protein
MYKITDIQSLGTEYNLSDKNGKIVKTVQIIPYTEILEAALGPYNESFGSYNEYLTKSTALLSGCELVDPYKVLWYASNSEEVILAEVIEVVIKGDYEKVILEYLEDLE